jgi:hypothetical protein
MGKTPLTASGPFLAVLYRSALFKVSIGALVLTGVLFWFPGVFKLFENVSLEIVYAHCFFGVCLGLSLARAFKKAGPGFSLFALWTLLFSGNSPRLRRIVYRTALVSVAFLLVSGAELLVARIAPQKLTSAFLYLHGLGGFLFFASLVFAAVLIAIEKKPAPSAAPEIADEWPCRINPGSFDMQLTSSTAPGNAQRFVQVFGMILKQSKLRLFFDGYGRAVKCQDIFKNAEGLREALPGEEIGRFNPGDYIISIYRKYFTLQGLMQRELLSTPGLIDKHIDEMAETFYGYVPCSRCGDEQEIDSQQGLMARYGRFVLAELGIRPGAFNSVRSNFSKTSSDTSASSPTALQRSLTAVEAELLDKTGSRPLLPLDKPHSDVVFFPAVHDFSGQSDTLRGLALVFHALKSNWTIGSDFFDGFNYGGFFGDWFVDRVMESLKAKAHALRATKIVLGGCQGISIPDTTGNIVGANDIVLQAITDGKIRLSAQPFRRIGYSGFCDEGCHLNKGASSIKILKALGSPLIEIGRPGNQALHKDKDLLAAVVKEAPDIIVAPFHNSRERLKFLLNKNNISIEVCGLFDLLVKIIKPYDE